MGIDRIGPNRSPVPPSSAPAAGPPAAAGQPFQVDRTTSARAAASTPPVAASPSSALDRVRAGHLSLEGYLELKVEEATGHLGALTSEQLESIRSALRDRLAADPALADLVRTATGQSPRPPHDD
jgi:hypothetical protein